MSEPFDKPIPSWMLEQLNTDKGSRTSKKFILFSNLFLGASALCSLYWGPAWFAGACVLLVVYFFIMKINHNDSESVLSFVLHLVIAAGIFASYYWRPWIFLIVFSCIYIYYKLAKLENAYVYKQHIAPVWPAIYENIVEKDPLFFLNPGLANSFRHCFDTLKLGSACLFIISIAYGAYIYAVIFVFMYMFSHLMFRIGMPSYFSIFKTKEGEDRRRVLALENQIRLHLTSILLGQSESFNTEDVDSD